MQENKKELADVIYENRRTILAAVIAVIAGILTFAIASHLNQKKREKASYFFSRGLQSFSEALVNDKGKALKLQEALEFFKKAEKVNAGRESVLARAMEGRVLIAMGKEKEGKKVLGEALEKLKGSHFEPLFTVLTDENHIKAYIDRGNTFMEDYARLELAMLYLKEGKKELAIKELKTLKGKFPNSPFAQDAEKILEVLK